MPIVGDEAVAELRAQIRGEVSTSSGGGVFNALHVETPPLVVRCSGTADVADAVKFARQHGVAVTVRGGGHSIAGLLSSSEGMLIDLSPMRGSRWTPNGASPTSRADDPDNFFRRSNDIAPTT